MQTRFAIALTLMAVAGGSGAAAASGAVVSGSILAGAAPTITYCGEPGSCTLAIADLPPVASAAGGPRAAINGVIVSWRVRSGNSTEAQPVRLRLIRNDAGAGTGSLVTLPKGAGTYEFPERLAVSANDRIGIDLVDAKGLSGLVITRSTSGASFDYWKPPLEDAEIRPASAHANNSELLLNVTIEPDADKDGFGDETQDKCPSSAATAGTCLPPAPIPTEAVPNTKVSEVRIEGAKATFRFSATVKGAKFRCRLDKKPWKSCKSPKVYRGLKEGRHSFKVKAIGPTAVPDPTPAKRTFKVKL